MPLPPHLRKPAALAALAGLTVLGLALAFRGWDRWVEDRLARWAVGEVGRRTGGAYRLVLGDLAFLPLAGSIAFDSAIVVTDSARNRRRAEPLPMLAWRGHGCRVSGVNVPRLLLRKALDARELGCDRVVASIALAAAATGDRGPGADSAAPDETEEDSPLGLTELRIGDVSFPAADIRVERPGERGPASIRLERARFEAGDLAFDPAAGLAEGRALSAGRARLTAAGLLLRPDTLIELAAQGLEADFGASTLRLAGLRHEPSIPESEWVRRVRVRRDRIAFELDTLHARGVDWRAFLASGGIGIRALELQGARLDVLTDRRIPKGRPRRHRTPQQWAALPGAPLRLDTLLVTGAIAYRERRPDREAAGRVSFDRMRATVLHLERPSRGRPLRIEAAARVMGAGDLTVEAEVPLDAPDFRYRLAGRLGPMPAEAFNRYLSVNEAFEFGEGRVEEIVFRQTAKAGRAATTLTPRYLDLSVRPTGDGGGIVGSVTRRVKQFVANALVVRSENPADGGDDFRVARTVRQYDPATTWLQHLWLSLRDGLTVAIREQKPEDEERPRRPARP